MQFLNPKSEIRTLIIVLSLLIILLLPSQGLRAGEASRTAGESARDSQEYIIGPEDVIEVSVWRNEALSKVVTVRPDGKISLPLIGDLQASGLTASQLKDEIIKTLKQYQEVPTVSVILREINSLNIFILGEVARPGQYRLRSYTTLLQAIALAGGFSPYASKNNMVVLRNDSEAGENRLKIRYDDIISGKDEKGNILLRPGDTIIVP